MPTRIAFYLLSAFAVTLTFVFLLIAKFIPPISCVTYHVSRELFYEASSQPARVALQHSWLIALSFGIVWFGSIMLLRYFPERLIHCVTVGLCLQGLVAWLAMFCFFYGEFYDFISLNRDPEFDIDNFMSFNSGVFPITFVLIVTPMILAVLPGKITKS